MSTRAGLEIPDAVVRSAAHNVVQLDVPSHALLLMRLVTCSIIRSCASPDVITPSIHHCRISCARGDGEPPSMPRDRDGVARGRQAAFAVSGHQAYLAVSFHPCDIAARAASSVALNSASETSMSVSAVKTTNPSRWLSMDQKSPPVGRTW